MIVYLNEPAVTHLSGSRSLLLWSGSDSLRFDDSCRYMASDWLISPDSQSIHCFLFQVTWAPQKHRHHNWSISVQLWSGPEPGKTPPVELKLKLKSVSELQDKKNQDEICQNQPKITWNKNRQHQNQNLNHDTVFSPPSAPAGLQPPADAGCHADLSIGGGLGPVCPPSAPRPGTSLDFETECWLMSTDTCLRCSYITDTYNC